MNDLRTAIRAILADEFRYAAISNAKLDLAAQRLAACWPADAGAVGHWECLREGVANRRAHAIESDRTNEAATLNAVLGMMSKLEAAAPASVGEQGAYKTADYIEPVELKYDPNAARIRRAAAAFLEGAAAPPPSPAVETPLESVRAPQAVLDAGRDLMAERSAECKRLRAENERLKQEQAEERGRVSEQCARLNSHARKENAYIQELLAANAALIAERDEARQLILDTGDAVKTYRQWLGSKGVSDLPGKVARAFFDARDYLDTLIVLHSSAPSPPAETERPERPPMLRARLMTFLPSPDGYSRPHTILRSLERKGEDWVDRDYCLKSADLYGVDRDASDAAALALYDADMADQQERKDGE